MFIEEEDDSIKGRIRRYKQHVKDNNDRTRDHIKKTNKLANDVLYRK